MSILRVEVPRKLKPLLAPKRYKGAYGGRGGAKSHFFAEQILVCALQGLRCVCIREIQNSIKDSVKQLLNDKVNKLGLQNEFEVLDQEIRALSGPGLIVFKGMQSYNAQNIKSLEAYDRAWVEEAQTLSQNSLDLLRPTIRNEGSELWFSWNPRYKTDPVDKFFRKNPPPEAVSVLINWRDNPWFPKVLMVDMIRDFEADPEKAEHVWNGSYGIAQGSILGRWMNRAAAEDRINDSIQYDPDGFGIEISSDLGRRDTAAWWFWQRKVGGYTLFDYDHASGLDAKEWIVRLQERIGDRKLEKIWLPHDAKVKTFQSNYSSIEQFLDAFGAGKCEIVPDASKSDRINAARTVLPRCEFAETICERGIDGLSAWEYEYNPDTLAFSKDPLHNWASHPSDAFSYGAQIMKEPVIEVKTQEPLRGITVGVPTVSLEEMWLENKTRRQRL